MLGCQPSLYLLKQQSYYILQMNSLLLKVDLLKDIKLQYGRSMQSAQMVLRQCQRLMRCLDDQLAIRWEERARLRTQVGVTLRDLLLEGYRGLQMKIYSECVRYEEICNEMAQQQTVIDVTIKNSELSIEEMQKIKLNEDLLARMFEPRLATQQIKENLPEGINQERRLTRVKSWRGEKKILLEESHENWERMMAQSKERMEMLTTQQRKYEHHQLSELNNIIDNCLIKLSDLTFLRGRKRLNLQGIKVVQSFSKHSPPQATNPNLSHGISLGLESLQNDEINLYCSQDLFPSRNNSLLQRITQREEEYSNSSSTPHKKLQSHPQ